MKLEKINNISKIETIDNCILYYIDGLCDIKLFYSHFYNTIKKDRDMRIDKLFPGICKEINYSEMDNYLYEGEMCIYRNQRYFHIDLVISQARAIGDSIIEPESPFQARDGFSDYIKTNISLMRTRIKDERLNVETTTIGRRSKTKIALFSINDIHNNKIKNSIIEVLNKIDIDSVLSIDDILAYFQKGHIFPVYQYVGSPEIASNRLYNGEFVLIIDRISLAIILPINMATTTKLPIDKTTIPFFTLLERIMVILCFIISTIGLGLFCSFITIDSDFLSLRWISILKYLEGDIAIPNFFQIMIILSLFELLYFITFRQSKITLSSTIVLVGGLIIGENLATSGIAGVIIITFTAIVFLAGFMVSTNITVLINISIIRLIILILSWQLGLFGVVVGVIILLALMYKENLFGVHYFYPFIPLNIKDFVGFFISSSRLDMSYRDLNLHVKNRRRRK